ncbi:MAG: TrbI/VirB10 family protein [Burkholderiaceae bacterium]|nr:TrbI/VirB10 family protein [Burkholderiaceae bacterium]
MGLRIIEPVSVLIDRMTPRARQWATAGGISAVAVGVLWAVFAMGSGDASLRGAVVPGTGDLKPTNVDLMAPGAQVREVEAWVGQAGRKLAQYESERDDQRRINRERKEAEDNLMRRFADLEARLKTTPGEPATPASVPAAPLHAAANRLPPDAALARSAVPSQLPPQLPPPPPPPAPLTSRAGMPPGLPSQVPPFAGEALAGPPQPVLVRVAIAQPKAADAPHEGAGKAAPPTIDTYLPVSFTRGVLLGGLDAPTGGQSQTNPHPILIRLSDNSVLPNRFRAAYRECFVIAAGYGDISSERAYLRTETLSCVRADGAALEVRIQGSVYGEDGKVGMRGRLVTKQGQMLANALLAGVVSGIGQGISTANTTYSASALGQVATTGGSDALRAGLGSGVGKALDRLAQYYIKLAEQTFPVIEVDAGREIDVVITKGVRIEGVDTAKASSTSSASSTSHPRRSDPAERYMKVNDDED